MDHSHVLDMAALICFLLCNQKSSRMKGTLECLSQRMKESYELNSLPELFSFIMIISF